MTASGKKEPATITPDGLKTAHLFLDTFVALELHRTKQDPDNVAMAAALRPLGQMLANVVHSEDGRILIQTKPFWEGATWPIYWLVHKLASAVDTPPDELVAEMREWLEAMVEPQQDSAAG